MTKHSQTQYYCSRSISDDWKDALGHVVLKLACAKSLQLSKWFVKAEAELLAIRLAGSGKDYAAECALQTIGPPSDDGTYYVPFESALPLVSSRAITIHNGVAAVPANRANALVVQFIRDKLASSIAMLFESSAGC